MSKKLSRDDEERQQRASEAGVVDADRVVFPVMAMTMEAEGWLKPKSALLGTSKPTKEVDDVCSNSQLAHKSLLNRGKLFLSRDIAKSIFSLMYAPSQIAAPNPSHESNEVVNRSVPMRAS